MQQTEKYSFNLIEGGDNFLPDPLNENAEKMEEALEALQTVLDGRVQVICSSYVGNGTWGSANPTRINLPFKPLLLSVWCQGNENYGGIWTRGCQKGYPCSGGYYIMITWGDNYVSWYCGNKDGGTYPQLSTAGYTYNYLALGVQEQT